MGCALVILPFISSIYKNRTSGYIVTPYSHLIEVALFGLKNPPPPPKCIDHRFMYHGYESLTVGIKDVENECRGREGGKIFLFLSLCLFLFSIILFSTPRGPLRQIVMAGIR